MLYIRLAGMEKYVGSVGSTKEKLILFKNGNMKTKDTWHMLFKQWPDHGRNWGENQLFTELGVYQLGWDSIVFGHIADGKFVLSQCEASTGNFEHCSVDSIVTRAVDTCTVIFLQQGNNFLYAHFNKSKSAGMFEKIELYFTSHEQVHGLCSLINEEESADFLKEIQAVYDNKVVVFERKIYDEGQTISHDGHFEIGLYIANGSVEAYGDITTLNDFGGNNYERPSILFNNTVGLINRQSGDKEAKIGGVSCRI